MYEVNGWTVLGETRVSGKKRVIAECPLCKKESVRRPETLQVNSSCRECYMEGHSKGGNRTARARVVRNYKKICAEKRGLEFALDDDQLDVLFSSECHYCGAAPTNCMKYNRAGRKPEVFWYNGIDRVDSSKGYTFDNVVSACSICNRAKGALSYEEFMNWIGRIK